MASELSDLTREQLEQLVEDMRHDWETMNQFVNTQATMFGWCDEYEERIAKYNDDFRVLKAFGRYPDGRRVSVRNAFAARRLVMGHVINTLAQHGIELPDGALCGVVRDHRALAAAHEQITARLKAQAAAAEAEEAAVAQTILPPGTITPI